MQSIMRIAIFMVAMVAIAPFATNAVGQQRGRPVHCGKGFYCPAGNACLVGGLCARVADAPPFGSVQIAKGKFCEPNFRQHEYDPGKCRAVTHVPCPNGVTCLVGSTCGADGQCVGGPPYSGPVCGRSGGRCQQGLVCGSNGKCVDLLYDKDCGNGTICTKAAACEHPSGCVYVSGIVTLQFKR
jgi:hypothetical protein